MNNKVSVIIPVKNEAPVIENCLRSIPRQKNIEIIVVDNFSTDKTGAIASQYTSQVYKKGKERSVQRNFGALKSTGNYLLFLDADMQLANNVINEALIKSGKNIIAFPEKAIGNNFWEKSIALERNLYQYEKLVSAARFFPKKLFEKLGGYDPNLVAGEDWDLTIRAQQLGYKLVFSQGLIIHQEKITSLKTFLEKKQYYISHIPLFARKHPHQFQQIACFKNRLKIYLNNWQKLITDPIHTIGFLFLKTLVWYNWRTYER